ncbi:hypothetical protein [uncultured Campylobacter sp.]|uniref:hypothetical protein n=1 Tax=uncultured Campylobacter sp. TaxID=218934 RepID=UPI00262A628E
MQNIAENMSLYSDDFNHYDDMYPNEEFQIQNNKKNTISKTLNELDEDKNLKPALNALEVLDENAKLIKEKKEQIKQTQKSLENKNENNLDKTIDDKADEAYNKQIDELLKQHESELARLKEERENLEQNFDKSIENLLNSKDLSDILKALQEMDKAFALMLKQAYEEGCALKKTKRRKNRTCREKWSDERGSKRLSKRNSLKR